MIFRILHLAASVFGILKRKMLLRLVLNEIIFNYVGKFNEFLTRNLVHVKDNYDLYRLL